MRSVSVARKALVLTGLLVVGVVGLAAVAWACTPNANIVLYPKSAQPGETIRVEGNQFRQEPVHLRWNGAQGEHLATTTGPTFSVKVDVPETAADGYHTVVAYAAAAPHDPKARFEVTSPSSQSDDPGSGDQPEQGETRNHANGGGSNGTNEGSGTSGDEGTSQRHDSPAGSTSQRADGNASTSQRADGGGATSRRADGSGGSPDNAGATTSQPQPAPSRDGQPSSSGSQVGQPEAQTSQPQTDPAPQHVGAEPDRRGQAPEAGRSQPDPQPQASQAAADPNRGEAQPGSPARDREAAQAAPADEPEPATGPDPNDSAADSPEQAEADTDGNESSTPARVPDRVATGDLWSGFDSPTRRSLAPAVGDTPAGAAATDGLAVGLGLFAAGLLTLLGGAFTLVARRSRVLANRATKPPRA